MNFLNYLLKAKGRHGTHSPYIYKFVADALHENTPARNYPKEVQGNKARTLFRVLSYLAEGQQLRVSPAVIQAHGWLQYFMPVITDPGKRTITEQAFFILSLEEIEWYKQALFTKEMSSGSSFLVLHPGNPDYPLLEDCFKQEWFNATLFTWDFSVLMNRPDFKRKQHFILR
ncbi:MAG: hypothetical protein EOP54_13495 [Sphingobacteriales bacterium]|nr:MAG: hypothetical protein EOP54_13495 [Sphingobacteriales bacterium]